MLHPNYDLQSLSSCFLFIFFGYLQGRAASDGIEHVQYFFKRRIHDKAYVVGTWVCPKSSNTFEVTKPAKDAVFSSFSLIRQSDTQSPNQAAYTSFPSWKYTTGNVSSNVL